MSQLEAFLRAWEREYKITLRLFGSYSPDRLDYRPHQKSATARELMWTIPFEEKEYIAGCIRGNIKIGRSGPPATKNGIIREYKRIHRNVMKRVRQAGEPLLSKRMNFCVGKNKVRSASVGEIFWFFLHDHIHHRGQLSVYLRLVGAKVPSIYGPSADEPW